MQKKATSRRHPASLVAITGAAMLIGPSIAAAHEGAGVAGGFLTGFTHPMLGWDHVAAMA